MRRSRWTIVFGLLLTVIETSAGAQRNSSPNILFIYTDDQAAWAVGSSGNPDVHTPNLDRLFSEGATLTNCFVTTPVCSPSRVGLLTGRYGTEAGITDWINPRGGEYQRKEDTLGLDPATPTWARRLQESGYATALIGKWHLGTLDKYHPTQFGYDRFIGFRPGGRKVSDPLLEIDGEDRRVEGLTMDVLTDYAIRLLRERDRDMSFALSLHYRAPHAPWLPVAEDDMASYEGRPLAIPNPAFPDLDTERVERLMREYLASVTGIDRNVGRLLGALDELGLRQNTVVIFTSDHGYNIGHHGLLHKGNGGWITKGKRGIPYHDPRVTQPNMYDTSLRVPCSVRWPGVIESGTRVERIITNLDWYPTLLAMAGLQPNADSGIHGKNFLPLLQGRNIDWDDAFYGEYSIHHYTEAHLRMFRTPEAKVVRDFSGNYPDRLYDLKVDPGETRNVYGDPAYSAIQAEMTDRLLKVMRSLGDPLAQER